MDVWDLWQLVGIIISLLYAGDVRARRTEPRKISSLRWRLYRYFDVPVERRNMGQCSPSGNTGVGESIILSRNLKSFNNLRAVMSRRKVDNYNALPSIKDFAISVIMAASVYHSRVTDHSKQSALPSHVALRQLGEFRPEWNIIVTLWGAGGLIVETTS